MMICLVVRWSGFVRELFGVGGLLSGLVLRCDDGECRGVLRKKQFGHATSSEIV